jgi:DNA-binding MarR family transcriptional regulator
MNEDDSLWARLGADINGDGRFTAGDLGSWLLEILLLPGDAFLHLLIDRAPGVAAFFELGVEDYGGAVSIWASVLIWLAAILLAGTLLNAIREFDRRLTSWALGRYEELQRQLRILRRRAIALVHSRLHAERNDDVVVETVSLANVETAVLRCLSALEDSDVMTLEELATRLRQTKQNLKPVIRKLLELEFIEAGSDTFTKRNGHRIRTAGQMYLLGA